MTGSIFSQLPNNLIMNIIKIAEDERKKEEKEAHQKKFKNVLDHMKDIEKCMLEDYSREERDMYEAENYIGTNQRKPEGCYVLGDLFWVIDKFNYELKQEREYYEDMILQQQEDLMNDPEYRYEHRYDNEPCEEDYDWGEEFEPSWA